jgi:hypothetical protein
MGGKMTETVRVAVVQDCPVPFDLQATIAKAEQLAQKAASGGAQLVFFPEAFVSGYPKGSISAPRRHAQPAGARRVPPLLRQFDRARLEECRRLGATARKTKTHLVIGVMEKDGGTLYCTVLFFGPDGALLGKHRKLMPTAMERLIWGFGDGSTLTVLDTADGQARRGDLLGKLHAALAHGDVRQGRADLLRADRGRPRLLGVHHAACRARGALLRSLRLPVSDPRRLPRRLRRDPGR